MKECNLLIAKSAQKIFNEVKDSAIDCQIHRAGTYRAAASELGKKSLRDYENFLKKSGLEYDRLNKDQLDEKLGTNYYSEGLYNPHCYLAQPAALIRALIDKLPKSIDLYENTPALSIKQDKKSWLIITPKASIRSKKIVIANNAFCAKLGFVRSYISPIYTYAAITEPLQENELLNKIIELNKNDQVSGILVQLPLPKHIDKRKVIEAINHEKDVDGFHPMNVGNLSSGCLLYTSDAADE